MSSEESNGEVMRKNIQINDTGGILVLESIGIFQMFILLVNFYIHSQNH